MTGDRGPGQRDDLEPEMWAKLPPGLFFNPTQGSGSGVHGPE
jgi:hypothetical protein